MFSEQCSDIKVIYAPQTLLRERSDTHVGLGLSLEHDPWKWEASAYLGHSECISGLPDTDMHAHNEALDTNALFQSWEKLSN